MKDKRTVINSNSYLYEIYAKKTNNMNNLKVGDYSENGQITIVNEDKLCYLV